MVQGGWSHVASTSKLLLLFKPSLLGQREYKGSLGIPGVDDANELLATKAGSAVRVAPHPSLIFPLTWPCQHWIAFHACIIQT